MTIRSTGSHYGAIAQGFHWLTVILVLGAYITSEGGSEAKIYSAAFDTTRRIHETFGLAVLAVVVLRLLWRLADRTPAPTEAPVWMQRVAKAAHILLYVLLFAVPLSAVFGTWFQGHPVTPLGFDFAAPMAPSRGLGGTSIEAHELLGNAILWLAGIHAAAALLHHFVLHDSVLRRMLPGGRT